MPDVLVTRNEEGNIVGFGEMGVAAWSRFMARVRDLEIGELLRFSYRVPRSPKFHRMHFRMLRDVYESQEQFDDEEKLRKWAEVGAGHCDVVPGPMGRMVAIPRSLAYEALDDVEFGEVHRRVKDFLQSPHATRFLWGHLYDQEQMKMIGDLLAGYDR